MYSNTNCTVTEKIKTEEPSETGQKLVTPCPFRASKFSSEAHGEQLTTAYNTSPMGSDTFLTQHDMCTHTCTYIYAYRDTCL